jgi:hypothetical protein
MKPPPPETVVAPNLASTFHADGSDLDTGVIGRYGCDCAVWVSVNSDPPACDTTPFPGGNPNPRVEPGSVLHLKGFSSIQPDMTFDKPYPGWSVAPFSLFDTPLNAPPGGGLDLR